MTRDTSPGAPMQPDVLPQPTALSLFVDYVLPPLATAAGSISVAVLALLVKWLREKAATTQAARVGLVFGELAQSIVADLEVTLRPKLQVALADGKLTPEEGRALKNSAMGRLTQLAPLELTRSAHQLFGPLLADWLSGLIERANSARVGSDAPRSTVALAPTLPGTRR